MTRIANLFTHFEMKKGGKVIFGDKANGKIIGIGQVGKKILLTLKMFFWLMV